MSHFKNTKLKHMVLPHTEKCKLLKNQQTNYTIPKVENVSQLLCFQKLEGARFVLFLFSLLLTEYDGISFNFALTCERELD